MRFVSLGVLLASTAAFAQPLSVTVMDAQALSEGAVKKLHRATVEQLKAVAGAPVSDAFDWRPPMRGCPEADVACQAERLKGSPAAVALWLQGTRDAPKVTAVLWLDGARASVARAADTPLESPEAPLRALVDSIVPAWLKKGMGGVRLAEEPPLGTVLKVDGRGVNRPKAGGVLVLSAGSHHLDLVFPDGRAVLQRVEVAEGSRTRVDVAPPAGVTPPGSAGGSGFSGLRLVSYTAWMLGAATLLSAFIVGFVGRQTAHAPCQVDNRGCVTIEVALESQRQAAGYASIANVLLVSGLSLSLAGAGLFTIDALR